MRTRFDGFRQWASEMEGIFTLVLVTIALVGLLQQQFSLDHSGPLLDVAGRALTYEFKIPTYLALILAAALLLLAFARRSRRTEGSYALAFLAGEWESQWTGSRGQGGERLRIQEDGQYFVGGKAVFRLKSVVLNPSQRSIRFVKSAAGRPDLVNMLAIHDGSLLVGTENALKIQYRRVAGLGVGEGLKIIRASYGAKGKYLDVTDLLRSRVVGGHLEVVASNALAGDPNENVVKTLTVEYSLGGQISSRTASEGEHLSIP